MSIFNGISKVAESVRGILDDTITTKEEKAAAILAQFEAEAKDRDSARDMYKDDSSLQKWFALVFLVAYMAMTLAMIYFIRYRRLDRTHHSVLPSRFGSF